MPQKIKTRPLSASRTRRQNIRRASLNEDPITFEITKNAYTISPRWNTPRSGIDLRTTKEKILGLENEMKSNKDNSTLEETLSSLVLIQLYTSLEYGICSIEHAVACVNLSKFYFDQKNFLPQANEHILKARQILEQLNIEHSADHLKQNLIAFDVYLLSIQCSFQAKKYLSQGDMKMKKNKHIKSIDTSKIDHDLAILEEYLEKLKRLMDSKDYSEKHMLYLLLKFDVIINNFKEYNREITSLIDEIIENINKFSSDDKIKQTIDIYLRAGFYFIQFDNKIQEGLNYYKKAVELAEEEERREPSNIHKCQLAKTNFLWGKAKVKGDRLGDSTERKFKRAIELYKQVNEQYDKDALKVIDELATYYTRTENFQDALNILCESLPDKTRIYGEFSEELIQTKSRIGAIYLRECEYINAAEHLKECYELQEFVYGAKDPRTCQTQDALGILKRDPKVARTFFSRTQDGIRQDRPTFKLSNKVSHDKTDHDLLLTVTKKPPIYSKN